MQATLPDLCPRTNISKVNLREQELDELSTSCMREYVINIVDS